MRSSRRGERGQVIPVVALFLVLLTGFVAIVVDAGTGYTDSRRDRNIADASALAGAYTIWAELKATPAATDLTAASAASNAVAVQNSCNVGSCRAAAPVYLASDNTTVTSTAQTAKYVRVTVTDASPNGFAQMIGGGRNIAISVTSEASVSSGTASGGAGTTLSCEVCVLGNVSFGSKDTDITAADGNIVINGNVTSCCDASFIAVNSPSTIDIQGVYAAPPQLCSNASQYPPTAGSCTTMKALTNLPFTDPNLAAPDTSGPQFATPHPAWSGDGYITPGVYPSITSGKGTLILAAGVYVITTGASAFAIAGGTIDATAGVTLYFACPKFPTPCTAGQQGAGFTPTSKGSTLDLTAPTIGPQANIAVYFDRRNTAQFAVVNDNNFAGNISGAMYMPAGTLNVAVKGASILGSPIIVQTISITGGGSSLGQLTGTLVVGGSSVQSPGALFCLTPPCRT